MRNRLAALALAGAIALTTAPAALAQSAGCDVYCDPVGGGGGAPSGTGSTGGQTGSGSSTPTTTPSTGGGSTSTGTGTTSSGTTSGTTTTSPTATTAPVEGTPAAPGELPRTGGDPLLIALFGSALLLMGSGMRLALPLRD